MGGDLCWAAAGVISHSAMVKVLTWKTGCGCSSRGWGLPKRCVGT